MMLFSDDRRRGQWGGGKTIESVKGHLVFVFRTGGTRLKRAKNEHRIPSSPVGLAWALCSPSTTSMKCEDGSSCPCVKVAVSFRKVSLIS